MIARTLTCLGLLALSAPALASNAAQVLVGTSTALDGDPASLRLSVRGELGLAESGVASASLLLPFTITTVGDDGFGFSSQRTLFELPVSLRGRLLPDSPVRPYGDIGAGVAIGTSRFDGWLVDSTDASNAFMTRTAVGVEIGKPEGLSFVVEPASWTTYLADQKVRATWGLMLGLGTSI